MAGSLGSLVVSLTAETAQFTAALSKASYTAERNFKQISSFAKTAAGSLAALYGASSAAGFIKSQIDLADATGKMAQKVGLSVEELSKLQYAAKLADVDSGQLQGGLVRLSKGMIEAANNTGTARNAFAAMGISIKNTDGTLKSSGQVLDEVANKFAGYEDSATKTALAVQLFGRAGADLIPLLNAGSAGIKEAGDELERFGAVISTNAAKNAELFNDNITRLTTVGSALGQSIANDILPYLNRLTSEFLVARANGLGFMDMLAMGLRSTDYDEQLKSIEKEITNVRNAWAFPLGATRDERLASLEKQKKTLIDLQTLLNKDKLMNPPVPKPEGTKNAPVPVDLAEIEKQAKEYAKGLGRAQDANSKFSASIAEMSAKAKLDIAGMFMTDAEKKQQADLITITKTFLDTQSEITKQYEEGRLKLKDYNEQASILAGGYENAIAQANEQYETQERLNGSYEYGAAIALAKYANESRNLANLSNGLVTGALRGVEDGLFNMISGSQNAAQAFSSMVTSILADIAKLLIRQSIVAPLVNMLSAGISYGVGNIATANTYGTNIGSQQTNMLAAQNAGMRAFGGQVSAGSAYLVGERGTETFVPSSDGMIIPNGGSSAGNVIVNVNMQNGSVDAQDGNKLGIMIGNVVKAELVKQKRAGGILA
jgi:phage-related minor tail protein